MDAAELLGGGVAGILFKHNLDVLERVFVTGHFISFLRLVGGGVENLVLTLLAQEVAHLGEDGRHNGVEQMMALNIEIGGLGGDTQGSDIVLGGQILILGIGVLALKLIDLGMYLALDIGYRRSRVLNIETTGVGNAVEIGDGELGIEAVAIHHDRPHKQREQGLAELREILAEVEDAVIVERDRHADIMQRRGVALKILDGIHIGVEDIRTVEDTARLTGAALNKIVVIGIDAGYHIATKGLALQKIHQHRLLAAREVDLRRQHDLEVTLVVLELGEYRAPEVDIVVALDIGHNPTARLLGGERIGRLEILAVDIIL